MRIEEVIGRRIRDRREGQEMTQLQLGQSLGPLLGREWSRQAVSIAERGGRALTAAELIAIAHVLGTTVGRMFTPPLDAEAIELPGGVALSRQEAVDAVLPLTSGAIFDEMRQAVGSLREAVRIVYQGTELQAVHMQSLDKLLELAGEVATLNQPGPEAVAPAQAIVAAIVTSDLGVLIGKRNDGKPPYTFIAGEQDAVQDENPADTAVREVKEETGLRIVPGDVIGERDHPKTGRHMVYVAAKPAPRASLDVAVEDTEELAEVRWVDLAELDDLMGAGNIFAPVREHLARELGEA